MSMSVRFKYVPLPNMSDKVACLSNFSVRGISTATSSERTGLRIGAREPPAKTITSPKRHHRGLAGLNCIYLGAVKYGRSKTLGLDNRRSDLPGK